MLCRVIIIVLASVACLGSPALAKVIYVAQAATGDGSADLNGDGIVDHEDLFAFYKDWYKGVTPTPEPTETPTPVETATLTPSPTPTDLSYPPSPSNVRLDGDEVPGKEDEFYETVTISWDPIPSFNVVDSSNYYMIDFGYGEEWLGGPATVRKATDPTSIVVNIDDSDLDPDSVELSGLIFQVMGVVVSEDGARFVGVRSPSRWFRLVPRPSQTPTPAETATPMPTDTPTAKITRLPSPANVQLQGENVPGKDNEFYETVTISWDPIPDFEIVDSSNYYRIEFGYGKEWLELATVRKATDSTSIVVNIDDSDLDQSSVENDGLIFYVSGVMVTEEGGIFIGRPSPSRWFRLLPRPAEKMEAEDREWPFKTPNRGP